MKAQRKTGLHLETNVTSRSHCSPDDTGELRQYPVGKYSPGVLVGEWQKAAALQRENDEWLQHRDCGRCADLRGAYCTWKPDVILRRTTRNGGYLYDRPPLLVCRDREPAQDCRLLHRSQLKSLYDQHYNEHPATQPAHVDCPELLPDGPTNFGLFDKMEVKWQDEIGSLIALRTGPSLYRESYQGQTKDNGRKDIHISCKNDCKSIDLKTDKAMLITGGLAKLCEPCTISHTYENTKVLSNSCRPTQPPAIGQCENTGRLLTCDKHSTALGDIKESYGSRNKITATCSEAKRNTGEHGCGTGLEVRASESENRNCNAGYELAGNREWQCNETGTPIHKSEPRSEFTDSEASERELRCGNNDTQFEFNRANAAGCKFPKRNIPDLEIHRKEVQEFHERNISEGNFQRRNFWDCDRAGIHALPVMLTKDADQEHELGTGSDIRKPGCTRNAYPEIGLTGSYVRESGLDQDFDRTLERMGELCVPPTLTPPRLVPAISSRHDACHACLNLSFV